MTTRIAVGAFLVLMLIMAALVATTGLRVEDFGPVMVFGVTLLGIGVLWRDREKAR